MVICEMPRIFYFMRRKSPYRIKRALFDIVGIRRVFAIIGFYEDKGGTVLDYYMNSSIATKAIKL